MRLASFGRDEEDLSNREEVLTKFHRHANSKIGGLKMGKGEEMQSTITTSVSQHGHKPQTAFSVICLFVVSFAAAAITATPALALLPVANTLLRLQVEQTTALNKVVVVRRGGVARRTTVVGPRGGVASRTVVRRGAVVRPGYRGGGVRWARPGWYRWPPGGAIAAGAAIGLVTAATAAAWAGAPPAPGYCWYYTDPSQRQGFWDVCR